MLKPTMRGARKWYRVAKKEQTTGGRSFRAFARDMFKGAPGVAGKLADICR